MTKQEIKNEVQRNLSFYVGIYKEELETYLKCQPQEKHDNLLKSLESEYKPDLEIIKLRKQVIRLKKKLKETLSNEEVNAEDFLESYDKNIDNSLMSLSEENIRLKIHLDALMDASHAAKLAIDNGDYELAYNKLSDVRLAVIACDKPNKGGHNESL